MTDSTIFPSVKRCTKCGETKSLDMFYKGKMSKGGYRARCKACTMQSEAQREKHDLVEKRCTGCGEIKPSSEFYSTNYGKSKIKSRCKCCTIAAKPKSKRVPKCRIFSREDLNKEKNDRRRKLVAGNGGYFTATDIAHMRYIQQGHCCYCGRVGLPLHLDHVIPITKGGPSDPWNLALCCRSCNSSKGDRLLEEWTNRWYLR